MNTSLELIIIRGVPGSGKSTKAKGYKDHLHVEADMYFIDKDGKYVFDREKLKDAHEWCMDTCRKALQEGRSVVVSNTFIRRWEVEPYTTMAKEHGAKLSIIEVNGKWRNEHGVPDETIERMRSSYESFCVEDFAVDVLLDLKDEDSNTDEPALKIHSRLTEAHSCFTEMLTPSLAQRQELSTG